MILIRHGPPSETNLLLGKTDITLDPIYSGKKIDLELLQFENPVVITSPLIRAKQTARLFGFDNPIIDERVSEMDLGKFEGQVSNQDNMMKLMNLSNIPDSKDHGGESVNEFHKRVSEFYDEYKNESRPVLVFTHAGVIRVISTLIHKFKPITYYPNYFEIVQVNYQEDRFENSQIQIAVN